MPLPATPEAIAASPDPTLTAPDMSGLEQAMASTTPEQLNSDPHSLPPAKEPVPTKKPVAAPKEQPKDTKPWDKKAEEATPEVEEPVEEAPVEEAPKDLKPEAKTRWGELRKIEEAHKKVLPEYEALKKEVETLRKAEPKIPQETEQELNELRQFRAAYDVENTPEFAKAVVEPLNKVLADIGEMAAYAKVDPEKLEAATDIKNRLERNKAIRNVLAASTEDISETDIMEVINSASQLHPLYEKADALRKEAMEIKNSLTGRERQQSEAQKQEQAQVFSKASEEIYGVLEANLKATGLLDSGEVAKSLREASQASVSEDPQMAAYQAQAGVLLPHLIELMNKDRTELREAKKSLALRSKASPGLGGSAKPEVREKTSEEAMAELSGLVAAMNGRSNYG